MSGGDEGKWMLGRVQKIRRRSGTKWVFSWQPVDLQNKSQVKYGKKGYSQPTLMVLLQWFISAPGRFKFKYEHTYCFWIDVEAIISTVTLSRDPLTSVYEIDHVMEWLWMNLLLDKLSNNGFCLIFLENTLGSFR